MKIGGKMKLYHQMHENRPEIELKLENEGRRIRNESWPENKYQVEN